MGAGQPGIRNGISVDQFAAERIGSRTRFPSLALSGEGLGLLWTRTGARVPAHNSPSRLFAEMFLDGQDDEVRARLLDLEEGRSILDDVRDQAGSLRSVRRSISGSTAASSEVRSAPMLHVLPKIIPAPARLRLDRRLQMCGRTVVGAAW